MKHSIKNLAKSVLVSAILVGVSYSAVAEEQKSVDEIAAELSNPNAALGLMNFNIDYISFDGDLLRAGSQSATRITFQPSLPKPLGNGMNLFIRPAIPVVISQDIPYIDPDKDPVFGYSDPGVNLGDTGFDIGIGKTFAGGIVALGGLVGTIPTATDDALGKDQWALGPSALLAKVAKWGAVGVLVTHQWDVAGDDDIDTNVTAGQYFWTANLSDGWQLRSGPTFAYDHEAESGQRLTFPVGVGIQKTAILAGRPWKFGVEYWHYIEQADAFGPDFQIRFTIAPVVPLPW
ncbi:hypothetical protein [Colwellia sp. MEBiC06753]